MSTPQPEWEPTEQDLALYRNTLSERIKVFAEGDEPALPLAQYEEIWPLWMWKRAVEHHAQFVAEFLPQLSAWWRKSRPTNSVPMDVDPAFKAFCIHLFLRWQWCYLQLVVATGGMPQPLRRRMRLCDLSGEEQQTIRIQLVQDFPAAPISGSHELRESLHSSDPN